jgi:protein OS-9
VSFLEEYVLEAQADALLQSQASPDARQPNNDQNNPQLYMGKERTGSSDLPQGEVDLTPFTYEEMILEDRRLLCQIPLVTKDDHNTTRDKGDSKAEEQKELARATDRGLELLREMEGKCMYYFSGWWSYSFCYQKQIKQFHALPVGRGIPHYPPIEDTTTHSFILGRFIGDKGEKDRQPAKTDVAELHAKGGSRYLVQHLRGGTKCDLTGRERKVEVQFHCHPQSTDHIGWIKELATCSYLMVIYTPRLCDDVAFLPPQQDEVHNIECREILMPDEVTEWEAIKEWYIVNQLADAAADADAVQPELQIVGGIEVGGRKLVGMEGKQIEKGRVASAGEERVEVVAKRENGEIRKISKQVLKKYDLDPEKVEDMKKLLDEQADGKDWTLEIVETNGVIMFQGKLAEDEDWDDDSASEKSPQDAASRDEPPTGHKSKQESEPAEERKPARQSEKSEGEGSEETFKDEL